MGPAITATVFGVLSAVIAYVFRPRLALNPSALRVAIFWLITAPILFLTPNMLSLLIICGFFLVLTMPRALEDRAAYYLMTLVAIPSGLSAPIPFPGINFLIVIDFAMIAALVLLAPPILFGKAPKAAKYAPAAGVLLILFTLLISVQEFRNANLTSGLRAVFYDIVHWIVPFMGLIRLLPNRDRFDRVFAALVFIGVFFTVACLISQGTRWNFYDYASTRFGISNFADVRQGFLRVSATLNTVAAGYVMLLGLLGVEYFRARRMMGFLMTWACRGAFLLTAFFTYSRGAWIAIIGGLVTYFFFTKAPRGVRPPLTFLAIFVGAPAAIYFGMNANLSAVDEFGTFDYRRRLIYASMNQIADRPLFGDANFRESENLAHMVQGQGIIDVVNTYLRIGMEHGLVGLGLFLSCFGTVIIGLLQLGRYRDTPVLEQQRAVLLGAIAGYLVLIFTTSPISLISHFGIILLALGTAYTAAARAELKFPAAVQTAQDRAEPGPAYRQGDLHA